MKNLYISIVVLIAMGMNVIAATKSSKEVRGDKYFFVYRFQKAIDYYTHAKNLSVEGQRRLAESYHNINQNAKSEETYSKLLVSTDGIVANDYFNYAMILKADGKNNESNIWMDKFAKQYPEDLRAKDYVAHKDEFNEMSSENGKYTILHLDINTEAEDFGTSYYKDKIVFASTRSAAKMIVRKYNWNGKPFLDTYVSDKDGSQLKKPSMFDKSLNGKLHDGPISFSKDGNFMAFTRNNYEAPKKNKTVGLEIWFSNKVNGKWSKPEPFILNNVDYSVTQPCLSADGNTMYFTSDMPGGYGGADIYKITKDGNGVWGKAENLGNKINTEGDETFPFFEENNGMLFFTSNGHFGLGGLDIFICAINGSEIGKVANAGFPLNTQGDDFGLIVDKDLKTGYFSSNRAGGSGGDDIYFVDILKDLRIKRRIPQFFVKLNVLEKSTNLPIVLAAIEAKNANSGDNFIVKTDEAGAVVFLADSLTTYNFCIRNKEIFTCFAGVTTTGFRGNFSDTSYVTLYVEKIAINKPIRLENIYYDYRKWDIRPDAAKQLDKLVKIMQDNPQIKIELGSHTDSRGSDSYNTKLSQQRAQSAVDYIVSKGISKDRIYAKGYGEAMPLNKCTNGLKCTDEEFQWNRRTEFKVVVTIKTLP